MIKGGFKGATLNPFKGLKTDITRTPKTHIIMEKNNMITTYATKIAYNDFRQCMLCGFQIDFFMQQEA